MKLTDFAILADENINPLLVNALRGKGFDVAHVNDIGLGNTPDHVILSYAYEQKRIVLTLDDDFGTLVFKNNQPFIGIIRLHPGHLIGDIHIPTLNAIPRLSITFFVNCRKAHRPHSHSLPNLRKLIYLSGSCLNT